MSDGEALEEEAEALARFGYEAFGLALHGPAGIDFDFWGALPAAWRGAWVHAAVAIANRDRATRGEATFPAVLGLRQRCAQLEREAAQAREERDALRRLQDVGRTVADATHEELTEARTRVAKLEAAIRKHREFATRQRSVYPMDTDLYAVLGEP